MTDSGTLAVAPSAAMEEAKYPIGHDSSTESPLPMGLSIIVDGRPSPLFFVSPLAAKWRDMEPGWYAIAQPGRNFSIMVTNVQKPNQEQVWGNRIPLGQVAGCKILVDGMNVLLNDGSYFLLPQETFEQKGFVIENRVNAEDGTCVEKTKPFRFSRVQTTDAINYNDASSLGCIDLQVNRTIVEENYNSGKFAREELPNNDVVNEKDAKKEGISVRVSGDPGRDTVETQSYFTTHIVGQEGSVKVFIRELWWLQAKKVVDVEKNPWRPTADGPRSPSTNKKRKSSDSAPASSKKRRVSDFIDLTGDDSDNESRPLSSKKKRKRNASSPAPSKKKRVFDFIDLSKDD